MAPESERAASKISVANALAYASQNWKQLPAWLGAAYEDGRVLFLARQVSFRNVTRKKWKTAEYNESLEFRHGSIVIRRCIGVC